MNKPSLIAAAVAAVLTTIGQGATAAPWTQARLDKVIGEQASGEEPVLQDIALKLDQSQIQSGASAAAVVVDGTRSASASRNSLTLALSEDFSLAELAAAEVSALGEDQTAQTSAQASGNMLNVQAQNVTASGRWTGASVESSSNALAQGNGLNVTAETLDVSSWGESTGFYGSVVDGSTGTASGSWVTMSVGTAEAREMQVAGAHVTGVSAEALNNKATVGIDENAVEALLLYGGRATAQPTSGPEQAATQAIASNNEVTGVIGSLGHGSELYVYAGRARAYGQDAVSVADGNGTRIEIEEIAGSSSQNPVLLIIHAGESNAANGYGDPIPQSSQASASSNVLTGYFGSVSGSDFDLTAGSAEAEGQDAVSVADSNRLTFEVATLSSNPYFTVTGGNSVAGSTSSASQVQSAQASASGNEVSGLLGSVNGRVSGMTGQYIRMVAGNAEAYGQDAVSVADSNRFTIEISSLASVPTTTVIGGTALAGYSDDDSLALSSQASASGNEVSGRFESISDMNLAMAAGNARAYGQDAVSFAGGNHLTFETATSVSNSTLEFYGGYSASESASGDLQSAQASASGNKVSGRFESVSDSTIAMFAGSAAANGQNVVALADGNQLDLEISSLSSSDDSGDVFSVIGGNSIADSLSVASPSVSAQASASGNEVSGHFKSVSDSTISMVAGSAESYGQNAVALADSNHLDLEISSLLSSGEFSVIGGNSVIGNLGFASLLLSAQTSASGNEVSGRFESVSDSTISMVAGSAAAYGQKAVSSADGNRLTFEVATSVSNSMLEVQGGLAMAGGESGDSQSAQASASGNLVTGVITGSFDQSSSLGISGGRAMAVAEDSTAVADNNRVQLSLEGVAADGSISLLLSGAVAQALTRAAAGGNLVVVSGKDTAVKTVDGTLYGAQVTLQRSGAESSYADASGNRVEVSGIKLTGSITGAQVRNENQSGSANAEGNVVVISNSTIEDNVTGANLLGSHINASGNTVILGEGTVVNGNVTAVDGANAELARSSGGEFSSTYGDNRVVMNNATVTGAVSGVSSNSGSLPVDMQTAGNTLVLAGHNEAGTIAGFETLDLTLPEQNKDQSVLTLTGGESTISGSTIVIRGAEVLEQGKLIEAVDGANLSVTDATVELRGTFIKKVAQNVDFTVTEGEGNGLTTDSNVLASAKVQATESASSLSESLLGTAAFVRQGAEFVADDGLATMEFAARSKQGLNAFAVMQGSSMHYDALSGVDVSGFTLLAGAAVQQGNLTFASFVESGWGNSEGDIAKNSTDLSYFGVGLAARYRFESGFYGEGAIRLGRASSDFAASFVEDGDRARYESDVFYATMHMAAGYELPLNDFVTADMYARYTFSFLDNDSVDLNDAAQSRAELDSVVAHALRIGARVKGGFTDAVNWKAGIAYEHMFDGAAGGTVDGVSITEAEMDGGSVIGELGVSVKPGSETSPWTLQFALKGYLGEREGVSGNGMLVYSF